MQGMELITPDTKQVVLCVSEQDRAIAAPVLNQATVIYWDQAEDVDFSPLADHDVILFAEVGAALVWMAKPAKLRVCSEPIPASFSAAWARDRLEAYPPTDSTLRSVQPYNPNSEPQKASPARAAPVGAGLPPDAPLSASASEPSETDLQAILGDSDGGPMPEVPEWVEDGPEPDLSASQPPVHDVSMVWARSPKDSWPTPQNPFGVSEPPKEFDTSVFKGDLSFLDDFCSDLSELKGTDYGIAALAAIVSLSAWVHESWLLQVKSRDATWKEAGRLWGFISGDSSDGKSVALGLATKPARDLDAIAGKEGAAALARYASELRIRDKKVADYEKRAAEDKLKPGETFPEELPKIEIDKRKFESANTEGLRSMLETTKKGWLYADEMSAWIASMGKYSAQKDAAIGERSQWLQAWDGGSQTILRSAKPIHVDSWSCCILGGVTDSSLRSTLGSRALQGDGLIQRFMVYHTRHQRADHDHEQDENALALMKQTLAALRVMRPADCLPLRLAPDAYQYFCRFMEGLDQLSNTGARPATCQSSILKFRSHAVRLALVLHLAMRGATGTEPNSGEYVELPIMKMACEICEQFLPHTIYFWESVITSGDAEFNLDIQCVCETIACWWIGDGTEAPSELTVPLTKIINSNKRLKIKTAEDARRLAMVMAGVANIGWIGDAPNARNSNYGNGLKTQYSVNPNLYAIWNDAESIINARKRRADTPGRIGAEAMHLRIVS